MKTKPIIDRIKAQCATLGGRVFGSSIMGDAEDARNVTMPYAAVMWDGTEFDQNESNQTLQNGVDRYGVVVFVSNADRRGYDAADELATIRPQLIAALVGYAVAPEYTPLQIDGVEFDGMDRSEFRAVFRFSCISSTDLMD